jgi:sec-independent protein translocase protein TatA
MNGEYILGGVNMLGGRIGFLELAVILVIALVIFGPAKIPEIGKAVGKGLREFKKETSNLMGDGEQTKEQQTKEQQTKEQQTKEQQTKEQQTNLQTADKTEEEKIEPVSEEVKQKEPPKENRK